MRRIKISVCMREIKSSVLMRRIKSSVPHDDVTSVAMVIMTSPMSQPISSLKNDVTSVAMMTSLPTPW